MRSYSFSGKHILLTGATGGLGSSLVNKLAAAGSHLVLSARSHAALTKLASSLPAETRAIAIEADLAVPGSAEILARKAIAAMDHIDVLFNNAGIGYFALMEEASEAHLRHLFEVNTFSPLALIRALLPHMKHRKKGRIINIASCAGRVPIPSEGVYGGSKTALAVMANTLRLELEPSGIDVVNIYPGTIDTPFETNALRENERPGLHPADNFGASRQIISNQIVAAAAGPSGEIWLDKGARWLATISLDWPKLADNRLAPLRDKVLRHSAHVKPPDRRRWRMLQLEASNTYNLNCLSHFDSDLSRPAKVVRRMSQRVWDAIRLHLDEVQTVVFGGGGERLPTRRTSGWIREAKAAGCETEYHVDAIHLTMPFVRAVIDGGIDRIIISLIGATAQIYAEVAKSVDFELLCKRIRQIAAGRFERVPEITAKFILAPLNVHQAQDMLRLAANLGVYRVRFKQCNIIRGLYVKGSGFRYSKEGREKMRITTLLSRARRLSRKLKIDFRSFSHPPAEEPVCDQDPRQSLYIRHEGSVAPCSNLAAGETLLFLDRQVKMPAVHYGRLPDQGLTDLWKSERCDFFKKRFSERVHAYDSTLGRSSFESSWPQLQRALQAARDAMPKPPDGCRRCPALYDI